MTKPVVELSPADRIIIRQVYYANANYGMIPTLVAAKWTKRARSLAERGLLKQHNTGAVPPSDWAIHGFTSTQAGIDAYNAWGAREQRAAKKKARKARAR